MDYALRITKHGERQTPKVALTFDDGPNPHFTDKFLDVLKNEGCTATFFLIGRWVEMHPQILKRMLAEGHTIGGHTYTHGSDPQNPIFADFSRGNEAIEQITGEPVKYLRVPGFAYGRSDSAGPFIRELVGVLDCKIRTGQIVVVDH